MPLDVFWSNTTTPNCYWNLIGLDTIDSTLQSKHVRLVYHFELKNFHGLGAILLPSINLDSRFREQAVGDGATDLCGIHRYFLFSGQLVVVYVGIFYCSVS